MGTSLGVGISFQCVLIFMKYLLFIFRFCYDYCVCFFTAPGCNNC